MPPVLKPERSRRDGLAFLGLSLSRKSSRGHPESATHQIAFDLDELTDRDYDYFQSTDDDGWLAGGGEPGPPGSYKLPARDSAHVEIMRIGTHEPKWGGISLQEVIDVMRSGKILIPQIEVLPTAIVADRCVPPEIAVRFDMPFGPSFRYLEAPLPPNWQIRFVHNQLFKHFHHSSRFCPDPFHCTIVRKAVFRSQKHKEAYFAMCKAAVGKWGLAGPRPLNSDHVDNKSGLWLFQDRTKPTHFFPPNFLPPYDTEEKRQIILSYLAEEWDEKTLSWKMAEYPERASDSLAGTSGSVTDAESAEVAKPRQAMGWCGNPIEKLLSKR